MYSHLILRPITIIRAVQFASVAVTAWSSAKPWGTGIGIGVGPPGQFDRQLVGAALLLLLGAIAVTFTGRGGAKPGRFALLIMSAASLAALALTLAVRSAALENLQGHLLLGGGWLWMAGGAGMSLGASGSAIALGLGKTAKPSKGSTKHAGSRRKP